jgi:hypothetical protein
MLRILLALISITILISCNSSSSKNKLFKPDSLESQLFTVNTGSDTTLRTKRGAVINIPKGALQSSGASVQLEIKEAYHISEMIRAGLTTQSNGQLLSSGGMIYINAVGGNAVKIAQPLKVSIPSNFINNEMQLFKGEVDASGNMNWINPTALNNVQLQSLNAGRTMFESQCASCHNIGNVSPPSNNHVSINGKPLYQFAGNNQMSDTVRYDKGMRAGPDLAHISKMRDRKWLYEFTRNNQKVLASGDQLAHCVYEQWNKTPMNLFPELTDKDLDILYGYIEHLSDSARLPLPTDNTKECIDSCRTYMTLKSELSNKKQSLINDNGGQTKEDRKWDTTSLPITDTSDFPAFPDPPPITLTPIAPVYNEGLFYQFNLESFGWSNVDVLIKPGPGMIESNLRVRIQGEYRERINVYLVLPSIRCFTAAGKVPDEKDEYVFVEANGKLYLPENAKGYIIVMGDNEDDILFAKTEFYVQKNNNFTLTPAVVTKAEFNKQMAQLNFDQLNITVKDSKNADELRKTIRDLKEAEKLKPKNCNCDCGVFRQSDTTASENDFIMMPQ